MLPDAFKQRVMGSTHVELAGGPPASRALEPLTTAPVTPAPLPSPNPLGDARRTELALALHERWHRPPPEEKTADALRCAELSGAFDDADAVGPLIASWIGSNP